MSEVVIVEVPSVPDVVTVEVPPVVEVLTVNVPGIPGPPGQLPDLDPVVSALIGTPSSEVAASLSAMLATLRPLAGVHVVVGDSNSAADGENDWPRRLEGLSAGRIRAVNCAVFGRTTAQMLAAFDAEVAPLMPGVVHIMGGTNDAGTGVAFATTKANISAMIAKAQAVGARVVLHTIVPRNAPSIAVAAAPTVSYASIAGSSIAAGTYAYKYTVITEYGHTEASAAGTVVVTSGTTNAVTVVVPYVPGGKRIIVYRDDVPVYASSPTATMSYDRVWVDTGAQTTPIDTSGIPGTSTPPATNTSVSAFSPTVLLATERINAWIRETAAARSITLVDDHSVVTDPLTGMWRAGYSAGLHAQAHAQLAMAAETLRVLAPTLLDAPRGGPALMQVDPLNLYNNGLFQTGTNIGGGASGRPAGVTYGGWGAALVLNPRVGFDGNCWSLTRASATATYSTLRQAVAILPSITSGFTPGDTVRVAFAFETQDFLAGGARLTLRITAGSTTVYRVVNCADVPPSQWIQDITIPAGATSIVVAATVEHGTGTVHLAQPRLVNLSANPITP